MQLSFHSDREFPANGINRPYGTVGGIRVVPIGKQAGADAIIGDMPDASQSALPQIAKERLDRLKSQRARIGVIGLGYVGLPLSLIMSEAGFTVTGFDIDASKVNDLEDGRSYIFRIPATEIQKAREQGFTATIDFEGLSRQDAILLCVPTPLDVYKRQELYVGVAANTPHLSIYWRPGRRLT